MKILKSARKDRIGEAINVHMIKTINIRTDRDFYYITVQVRDDKPEKWFVITNYLSLKTAEKAYKELIEVLRAKSGYDEWTKGWINIGEC